MINYDKLLELRFALEENRFPINIQPTSKRPKKLFPKDTSSIYSSTSKYPAKKKKRQKPQKTKVKIEDVSDGKL